MTRYLLDTNIFIQARHRHYRFDFCPAFWEWLIRQHGAGIVFSIEAVYNELKEDKSKEGKDDLFEWVKQRGSGFFMPPDEKVFDAYEEQVIHWAETDPNHRPAASKEFLAVADSFLVAHALAHDFTVVTYEARAKYVQGQKIKRIKIPNACDHFMIDSITPYEMLSRERARFVL